MTSSKDADRLSHIEEAVDRVSRYAAEMASGSGPPTGTIAGALNDAVLYNLAVIGEAVKALRRVATSRGPAAAQPAWVQDASSC